MAIPLRHHNAMPAGICSKRHQNAHFLFATLAYYGPCHAADTLKIDAIHIWSPLQQLLHYVHVAIRACNHESRAAVCCPLINRPGISFQQSVDGPRICSSSGIVERRCRDNSRRARHPPYKRDRCERRKRKSATRHVTTCSEFTQVPNHTHTVSNQVCQTFCCSSQLKSLKLCRSFHVRK